MAIIRNVYKETTLDNHMRKLKKILRYVTAKDLFEDLKFQKKLDHLLAKEFPEFRPKKLIHKIQYVLGRYIPLPFEIDGVRRIVEGQYLGGSIEILATECFRFLGYLRTLDRRYHDEVLYKKLKSEKERKINN